MNNWLEGAIKGFRPLVEYVCPHLKFEFIPLEQLLHMLIEKDVRQSMIIDC